VVLVHSPNIDIALVLEVSCEVPMFELEKL